MSAPETLKAFPIYWNNSSVTNGASVNQAGVDVTGYKRLRGALALPAGTAVPTTIRVRQGDDVTNWSSTTTLTIDPGDTTDGQVYPVDIEIKYPYVGIFYTAAATAVLRAYVTATTG